jgi:hypothetical protein
MLFASLLISSSSLGQRVKYRHCKNQVSLENYRQQAQNPKYSPVAAGVLNYLFPAAGYIYVGEPLRGAGVFAAEMATFSVFVMGLTMTMGTDYNTGKSPAGARETMFAGIIATGIIHTWSIFDVVKVAKVKNIAYQGNGYALRLVPDFQFRNTQYSFGAQAGVKLCLMF